MTGGKPQDTKERAEADVDIQNHFYGHSSALAAYLGLPRPRHIAGLLQHGWVLASPTTNMFIDFPDVERNGRRRLFAWTHDSAAWSPATSPRPTVAIGSPWEYLLRVPQVQAQLNRPGCGTFLMPVHSSNLRQVSGDVGALAAFFADSEGPCTVSVHGDDLARPEAIRPWLEHGHRVVSAGDRHDPQFLPRLLGLMLSHERVVSNRLMTSIFYAALLGRSLGVYGDPLRLTGERSGELDRVEALYPQMHGSHLNADHALATAQAELGTKYLRESGELSALLGWSGPVSLAAGLDYWTAGPVRKALNVLGVTKRDKNNVETAIAATSPLVWLRHPLSHLPRGLPRGLPSLDPLPEPIRPM